MPEKRARLSVQPASVPLPELVGRVAVLGGTASDKATFLIGLALRQVRQQGTVLCLDGGRHKQTELQFRLLLRGSNSYVALPPSGEVPSTVAQTMLSTLSRSLATHPPLLLLDDVQETAEWERTLTFLLNAGVVVVEVLSSPTALVFGRYDTILLLRTVSAAAEELSQCVGRRVSAEVLTSLKEGEGFLIHLARVWRVVLPAWKTEVPSEPGLSGFVGSARRSSVGRRRLPAVRQQNLRSTGFVPSFSFLLSALHLHLSALCILPTRFLIVLYQLTQ
jgi:hypothetical protein